MAEGYDNTNSGALHAPRTEKLIRSGTVDIDGTEYRMAIVQSTIPDKQTGGEKQIFETYLKVGNMFQTEKKTEKIRLRWEVKLPGRGQEGLVPLEGLKAGNKYTAVSMAPLKATAGAAATSSAAASPSAASSASEVMDDDIRSRMSRLRRGL